MNDSLNQNKIKSTRVPSLGLQAVHHSSASVSACLLEGDKMRKKNITIEDITPDIKSAVNAVLMARAMAETERMKMDKMMTEILSSAVYMTSKEYEPERKSERIVEAKITWLMSKEDFADFNAECQKRIREMGYKTKPGQCPALVAEDIQRTVEHVLIDCAEPVFGVDLDKLLCAGMDKYHKYIKLLCGLVVNLPGFKNSLTA